MSHIHSNVTVSKHLIIVNLNLKVQDVIGSKFQEYELELNRNFKKLNLKLESNPDGDSEAIQDLLEDIYITLQLIHESRNAKESGFRVKLCKSIADSAIAIAELNIKETNIIQKIRELGANALVETSDMSIQRIIDDCLFYHFLKRFNLQGKAGRRRYRPVTANINKDSSYTTCSDPKGKYIYTPSEEDIDLYFEDNKKDILQRIKNELGEGTHFPNPMELAEYAELYERHLRLK